MIYFPYQFEPSDSFLLIFSIHSNPMFVQKHFLFLIKLLWALFAMLWFSKCPTTFFLDAHVGALRVKFFHLIHDFLSMLSLSFERLSLQNFADNGLLNSSGSCYISLVTSRLGARTVKGMKSGANRFDKEKTLSNCSGCMSAQCKKLSKNSQSDQNYIRHQLSIVVNCMLESIGGKTSIHNTHAWLSTHSFETTRMGDILSR